MKDAFPAHPETFGGVVVRIAADGRTASAVATLVDATSLELLASHASRVAIGAPDGGATHDGLPALIEALAGLPGKPDIVLVDGHGTADAARAGTLGKEIWRESLTDLSMEELESVCL